MGNTRAWPVSRTTDLAEALSLAEKLLSVASWHDPSGCYLVAWAHSDDDLRRLTEASPGVDEEYKYAELQIACNSHTIHCEDWAVEHTVFVHARPGDDARPDWLAAQVGSRVVGPAEFGW